MPKYYLAVDIGASSGRHIVGWSEGGKTRTEEVFRFPNGAAQHSGHLTWDMEALLDGVKRGIAAAMEKYPKLESLSIDTWGCDYVLMEGESPLWPCYAYRDRRTEAIPEEVHAKLPFSALYRRTGCQFQPFNTLYQLVQDRKEGRLERATDFLMIPEYLMYRLTGVKKKEFTNATTTGLVNAETGEFDREIIARLDLPERLFPKLARPGEPVGTLLPEVRRAVGGDCPVILCATHDTASAVEGIPMEGNHPYISSGTWSLLGVKTPGPLTGEASLRGNWSNEGGVGYNRYQKNIMGMWLVNRLREELCPEKSFSEIAAEAEASRFSETVDTGDGGFLAPADMKAAFDKALGRELRNNSDYFRCAYRSLALAYRDAVEELQRNTGKQYDRICIVGGGAKNAFLNALTEEATGKQVIALPIEATALGNLKIQMEAGK